jgi:hypothetical protein
MGGTRAAVPLPCLSPWQLAARAQPARPLLHRWPERKKVVADMQDIGRAELLPPGGGDGTKTVYAVCVS